MRALSSSRLLRANTVRDSFLRHPVYDMLYFVLARRNAATLFTLDRKLQQLCLDNGVDCVLTDTNF